MEVEPLTVTNGEKEEGAFLELESCIDQCNVCVYIHINEQQTNRFNKLTKCKKCDF